MHLLSILSAFLLLSVSISRACAFEHHRFVKRDTDLPAPADPYGGAGNYGVEPSTILTTTAIQNRKLTREEVFGAWRVGLAVNYLGLAGVIFSERLDLRSLSLAVWSVGLYLCGKAGFKSLKFWWQVRDRLRTQLQTMPRPNTGTDVHERAQSDGYTDLCSGPEEWVAFRDAATQTDDCSATAHDILIDRDIGTSHHSLSASEGAVLKPVTLDGAAGRMSTDYPVGERYYQRQSSKIRHL
ncbi:hypothetical protein SeLEV6574_g01879 [Synchytrium endobioticum]|uniref:Uncharacterized protein n=1 Tax=Synchytrium endobioticum TaxID=286115 RepID=A0A507DBC9_9FUNG|nr:hypothetical protein SeLEV6574_g01879 [Synchytrium endobioticum]